MLDPLPPPALADFRPETIRGTAGYFRVAQTPAGAWWLLDRQDRPFFGAAVEGPEAAGVSEPRLRAWNFNTCVYGVRGADVPDSSLPRLLTAGVSEGGPWVHTGGARLPDAFDHAWPEHVRVRAERVCADRREDAGILGWRLDEALDWAWSEAHGRPTLLQLCLSLDPRFAAYHAAWEFTLALHDGSFERLAAEWQVPLTNKEMLRAWTQAERGIATGGYLADHRLWSEQYARRYFATAAKALRAAAPYHLKFAPSCGRMPAPPWLAAQSSLLLDVGAFPWSPEEEGVRENLGPCWIDGFTWADPRVYAPPCGNGEALDLTRVERMLQRGRRHLARIVDAPDAVGWTWRGDDGGLKTQWEFGPRLVRPDGSDAAEHTDLLAWLNARAPGERARLG